MWKAKSFQGEQKKQRWRWFMQPMQEGEKEKWKVRVN